MRRSPSRARYAGRYSRLSSTRKKKSGFGGMRRTSTARFILFCFVSSTCADRASTDIPCYLSRRRNRFRELISIALAPQIAHAEGTFAAAREEIRLSITFGGFRCEAPDGLGRVRHYIVRIAADDEDDAQLDVTASFCQSRGSHLRWRLYELYIASCRVTARGETSPDIVTCASHSKTSVIALPNAFGSAADIVLSA